MNNLTTSPVAPVLIRGCRSKLLCIGNGRYTDDIHRCLNHRYELYSRIDFRVDEISQDVSITVSSTDSRSQRRTQTDYRLFTDSAGRLPFQFKETNFDTLSFTENSDRLVHKDELTRYSMQVMDIDKLHARTHGTFMIVV